MTSVDSYIAANRFGLGPKGGYLGGIATDPQSWLLRQLGPDDGALPYLNDLPGSDEIVRARMQARGSREMRNPGRFGTLTEAAGRLLAANQGTVTGRLARNPGRLASGLDELSNRLEPVWRDTVICVVTEFGRTVRMNGSKGTDHGTGGAVSGGHVATRWPGLDEDSLYGGRDLTPTSDLRGLFKTVLHDHLNIPSQTLESSVFPESENAAAPPGKLIRS